MVGNLNWTYTKGVNGAFRAIWNYTFARWYDRI